MDPITLGLAAAGAYLLMKSQSSPAAAAPAAPAPTGPGTAAVAPSAEAVARAVLQQAADAQASAPSALVSPGGVPYLTASAETQAANDKSACDSAGGYWVPTDLLGISKTKGVCSDPQKSSAGCQGTGGTWTGAECAYPGTQLMGLGDYGDGTPTVWTPGLVIAAGALAFAWYAARH